MVCFIIYICANIGLAVQNHYAALLVLRMLQSSGSSGTVAISNAIAADIVTSTERGSYVGYATAGTIAAPALAPVIGGLLDQYAGWKWIFWFLVIFASSFFVPLLLFFPETCRAVVGNGSLPPPAWNMSLLSLFQHHRARRRRAKEAEDAELGRTMTNSSRRSRAKARMNCPSPLGVLRIIADRVNFIILLCIALLFAAFYAVSASISARFAESYGYSTIDISLVFIPFGVGALVSALTVGRLMDWNYRRHAQRLGLSVEKGARSKQHDMLQFPIEQVRLEVVAPFLFLGAALLAAYGWCVQKRVNVSGPIVLLFLQGYTLVTGFQSLSVLIVDLNRTSPATATAANNLVRCLLGAGASAVVNPLTEAVGYGWTCTIAALLWLGLTPLLLLLMKYGQDWRRKKAGRVKAKDNGPDNGKEVDQNNSKPAGEILITREGDDIEKTVPSEGTQTGAPRDEMNTIQDTENKIDDNGNHSPHTEHAVKPSIPTKEDQIS
ncbi:MAG: hypothetical protein Q9157_003220 [Trypethelium eluteriae]